MRLDIGMKVEAELGVEYGPLRLAVAEHFGIDPAHVSDIHMTKYEQEPHSCP